MRASRWRDSDCPGWITCSFTVEKHKVEYWGWILRWDDDSLLTWIITNDPMSRLIMVCVAKLRALWRMEDIMEFLLRMSVVASKVCKRWVRSLSCKTFKALPREVTRCVDSVGWF